MCPCETQWLLLGLTLCMYNLPFHFHTISAIQKGWSQCSQHCVQLNWTKKTPHAWIVFLLPAEFLPLDSPFQRNPELSCPLILASPRLKTVTVPSLLLLYFSLLAPSQSKSQCFCCVHILWDLLRGSVRCAYFECNEVSWKFTTETLETNKPWVKMHLTSPHNRLLK